MKKIIFAALAVLMMLGFVGCSGVLHDFTEPVPEKVTIDGASWYYFDITVWGDSASSNMFIINNNGNDHQTIDTEFSEFKAKDGAVFYYTLKDDDAKNLKVKQSFQDDNPAYTPKPGVVRMYVYTDMANPTIHLFDNKVTPAYATTSWPGKAMNKVGAVVREEYEATMQIASITVTGIPSEYQSLELYARGASFAADWAAVPANKGTIVGDTLTITYSTPVSVTKTALVGDIPTEGFKIATSDWKNAITNDKAEDANVDISVLNGKKVAIIGTVNDQKCDDFATAEYKRVGCNWSIQVLGDIE